jgi:hypothetical protein
VRLCRRAALGVAVVLLVLGAEGCRGSGGDRAGPTTAPAPEITAETSPPTAGSTTTTRPSPPRTTTTLPLDLAPGSARISGTVVGPQGPVAGATVRVERLLGTQVASTDVGAGSGSFNLPGIRGGRYRVRAWKTPDLVQTEPEVFFLAADEVKTIELRVTPVSDISVQATVEPDALPRDEPFTINVFVYAGVVGDQGTVQAYARANVPVQIVLGPGLGLQSPDRATTDSGGNATFRAVCRQPGQQTADVIVGPSARLPLGLPACPD